MNNQGEDPIYHRTELRQRVFLRKINDIFSQILITRIFQMNTSLVSLESSKLRRQTKILTATK